MICTAGHVDHGKTSLVKLLTGCNTDRLKIEQERGMTIELGFAPCFLGGNLCVGIVDVPGHEKFIANMVAGVSGIGMALLVIAADDGVMPQTVEHFQVLELLGVRRGMVALTKIDLVDEARLAEVTDEVRTFLAGTFMHNAPICPVSAETFVGYFELYETLVKEVASISLEQRSGIFRMPVERSFSREGFGAVATGIPVAGSVRTGDTLEVVPGGERVRVRGIERFTRPANEGSFGQCLALNLTERVDLQRGQVLAMPGYVRPCRQFHINLRTVPALERPLRNAEQVKFHTGTAELDGKLYLLESREYGGSCEGLATVVLAHPVAAGCHDRFLLRRPSPSATVAGGRILAGEESAERRPRRNLLPSLAAMADFFSDASTENENERRVEYVVRHERPSGASLKEVARSALLTPEAVKAALSGERMKELFLELSPDFVISRMAFDTIKKRLVERIREITEKENAVSTSLSRLRSELNSPSPVWPKLLADVAAAGLAKVMGDKLLLQQSSSKFTQQDRDLLARLERLYQQSGFSSPRPDELPKKLNAPAPRLNVLLEHLLNSGTLVRLSPAVVLSASHYRRAQELVVHEIQAKGSLDSADFKNVINSTRKYALAILDHMDSRRVTIRVGNIRKLANEYEKRMM